MLSAFVGLGTLVGFTVGFVLFFLPTLVAKSRCHPNTLPIFLVNLFFGWTFVGWVVSLIWASTRPVQPVFYTQVYPTVFAPPQRPVGDTPRVTVLSPASRYPGLR